jgi:hypothetical protein
MPEKIIIQPVEITGDQDTEAKKKAEAAAKKKKEEQLKKEANKPPQLHYFDVKVESMLPATLTYRVLAEDAQQAAEKIRGIQPNSVQHRLIGRKDTKLTVYDAGSTMIKWMKRLIG